MMLNRDVRCVNLCISLALLCFICGLAHIGLAYICNKNCKGLMKNK